MGLVYMLLLTVQQVPYDSIAVYLWYIAVPRHCRDRDVLHGAVKKMSRCRGNTSILFTAVIIYRPALQDVSAGALMAQARSMKARLPVERTHA